MNNEFQQAIYFFNKSGNPSEHYTMAEEIVNEYIEEAIPADDLFHKAIQVINLIKDGNSKAALKIELI